ncbi:MAG: cytochrome c [Aromatoleum sp.]|nr:cytochrome c [Aromatoleum sp.]
MVRVAPIVAAAVLAAMTLAAAPTGRAADEATPDAARQRELITLLRQDCGSCHGMRLTGGLGPALTPEALKYRPAESLVATIVSGRPGTAMPPWRRFVSEAEAQWLVAQMMAGATGGR